MAAIGLIGAFFLALPLAVYWKSLSDFFMMDDFIWLKAAASHDAVDLLRRETSFSTALDPFDYPTPYMRPLTDAYFFITWRVFGFDPTAYHALNLLLHMAIGILVGLLGWLLSRSRLVGALSAVLFVVLPTYAFAVSWVSEATGLLSALFYLTSLVLFIAYLRRPAGRRSAVYALSLAAFALALAAKEPAITLAGVIPLAALAEAPALSKRALTRAAFEALPFVVLAAAFYLFVYHREYNAISAEGGYRIDTRFFANFWAYVRWLSFPFGGQSDAVRVVAAPVFLAAGAAALLRRHGPLSFLFLWTLVCLVPLSFFEHGIDHRYAYLASVPFALFVVIGLQTLFAASIEAPDRAALALCAVVTALLPALALEARAHQASAHTQAALYRRIYEQVPQACGPLAPGSKIALVGSTALDPFGIDTQVALNFSYERVEATRYESRLAVPPAAPGERVCVVEFQGGRFVKVE